MADKTNLQLGKLAISVVSVAALAGVAGRLTSAGSVAKEGTEQPAAGAAGEGARVEQAAPDTASQGSWWVEDWDDDHDDDDDRRRGRDHDEDDDDDDDDYWDDEDDDYWGDDRRTERQGFVFAQPGGSADGGQATAKQPRARSRRS